MESSYSSPGGASSDEGSQDGVSPSLLSDVRNQVALVAEAALSVALHEVFGVVLVDQFLLVYDAPNRACISMNFRSPRRYSEVLSAEQIAGSSKEVGEALSFLESQVGNVLTALFRAVHINEVAIDVNRMDQLSCSITVSVPIDALDTSRN
jgi:hypothetical protein